MSTERFERDTNKAESNEKKHNVTFVEATSVFHDDYALYFDDKHIQETRNTLLL